MNNGALEKLNQRQRSLERRFKTCTTTPSELACAPFHIIDNIYYVGTQYVSSFLFDAGCGLILIDAGFAQASYQLVDHIYSLGFNPHNIKKLLITHAHADHCGGAGAIQEISGCEIYLGQKDAFILSERRDLLLDANVPEFAVTQYYQEDSPITLGDVVIFPKESPGHTPGTTSFLYPVECKGKTLCAGTYGGLGINGLSKYELAESRLPVTLQSQFLNSIDRALTFDVDICLPSHGHNLPSFFDNYNNGNEAVGYIDNNAWPHMLLEAKAKMEDLMSDEI